MTEEQPDIRPDVPHGARIWNHWLGGKDNYAADREVGDAVQAAFPEIVEMARRSREFLVRSVRYLVQEAGVDQLLDVGTGLPTMQNTHEVALAADPQARVVYVDNDPLVLVHARALLFDAAGPDRVHYLDADYRDPAAIIAGAREHLDLSRPVAVLCMGIFGYVESADEAGEVVHGLVRELPSGSHLALWDGTSTSEGVRAGAAAQAELGSPYHLRTVEEIRGWFGDLELVEPGLVPVTQWRPTTPGGPIDAYGAVGRKP